MEKTDDIKWTCIHGVDLAVECPHCLLIRHVEEDKCKDCKKFIEEIDDLKAACDISKYTADHYQFKAEEQERVKNKYVNLATHLADRVEELGEVTDDLNKTIKVVHNNHDAERRELNEAIGAKEFLCQKLTDRANELEVTLRTKKARIAELELVTTQLEREVIPEIHRSKINIASFQVAAIQTLIRWSAVTAIVYSIVSNL